MLLPMASRWAVSHLLAGSCLSSTSLRLPGGFLFGVRQISCHIRRAGDTGRQTILTSPWFQPMMTAQTSPASASDAALWSQVCNDDVTAFRSVVERHQSAVSAVAYAICGEFAASEDAAQEAFLTAWRERTTLAEPSRLRAWLCGIGRNMARNIRRRQNRDTTGGRDVSLIAATDDSPEQAAVSREEESLVWDNLEQIPETYREPLVLFYREAQSVAEVARSLELSEEVVRQRLSRGRAMLREQVMSVVERTLIRSRPKGAFTSGVLAGVTCIIGEGTVASAATATSSWGAAKTLAATGSTGTLGGLVGSVGGAAGGWFGTWCSAQMAPTATEREYLLSMGRRLVALSLGFFVFCFVAVRFGPRPWRGRSSAASSSFRPSPGSSAFTAGDESKRFAGRRRRMTIPICRQCGNARSQSPPGIGDDVIAARGPSLDCRCSTFRSATRWWDCSLRLRCLLHGPCRPAAGSPSAMTRVASSSPADTARLESSPLATSQSVCSALEPSPWADSRSVA